MKKIDLNCDLGESFGAYTIGQDELVLDYISSANIACGFHAGDPMVMARTIQLCLDKSVAIGAHPGYPDLLGFGRRAMDVSPQEIKHLVMYQISALQGMTQALGGKLQHVKPHGALYNTAATNQKVAEAIAEAIYLVSPEAILFGLAESELTKAGERIGLVTAHEAFADRTYQANGRLTPRHEPRATIYQVDQAIAQVMSMITAGKVKTVNEQEISIKADTICLHGDSPSAAQFSLSIAKALKEEKIQVESIGLWKV